MHLRKALLRKEESGKAPEVKMCLPSFQRVYHNPAMTVFFYSLILHQTFNSVARVIKF